MRGIARLESPAAPPGNDADFHAVVLDNVDAFIYIKAEDGRYLYASPKVQELYGRPLDEIIGRTDEELLPPEAASKLREFDREVMRSGKSMTREEQFRVHSGTERCFLSKKMAVTKADGSTFLIGFSTDITERKHAEQDLRRSEEALTTILESLPYPTMVTTLPPEERVTIVNRQMTETFGYTGGEFATLHEWSRLAHPDESYRGEVTDWWNAAIESAMQQKGAVEARELRVTAKDGRVHDVIASATVAGERLVLTLRDITKHKEEEERLRISEQRHRSLAESARDTVWTMEPDGRVSYVSPSVEIVRGFTPDEAMAQTPDQIHPPESLTISAKWWEQMQADIAAGRKPKSFRGELAYYRKDGSVFWTEVMAYPLLHPDGSLAQVVGVTRDIAERKEAELLLKRSEAKFRSIFEASSYGLVLLDSQGRFTEANPTTLEMFGCPDLATFLRSTAADLSPPVQPCGRPTSELVPGRIKAALAGEAARFEWIHKRMDNGHEFPCEVTLVPIELDGKPAILAQVEDLTEKKEAEEALRQSEELFRVAFDKSPLGACLVSSDGRLLKTNPRMAEMFGYSRQELETMTVEDLAAPEDVGLSGSTIKHAIEDAVGNAHFEKRYIHRDGHLIYGEVSISLVRGAAGEPKFFVSQVQDITKRKLAEQALLQREKELEQAKEHYRLLVENSTDVIVQGTNEGIINWVTPSVTGLVGWRPEEMTGHDLVEFVHPEDLDALRPFQENLRRGVGGKLNLRIRLKSGGYHWVSAVMRPVFDSQGIVIGGVAGWRDIHAEMLSRAAIENERARLKATLDSLLDPQILLRPVRGIDGKISDFVFADANPAACAHDHVEHDELVGKSLLGLFPNHRASGLFDKYCETVETGRPLVLENFPYRDEMAGGTERRISFSGAKVGDALSLTWRDVTEHYLTTEMIARSEEHYRLLSSNAFGAVLLATDAGVMTWVSPSVKNVLGYEPDEWIGRPATDFMTPDTAANVQANIQRAIRENAVVARYRARDKNGALHWVETHTTPYVDSEGRHDGIVVSFHVIDEQVAAEQELERRARTDELTKLLNRREILERIDTLKGRSPRSGQNLAVLFVDFDKFKTINDTHGHAAGDEVLRVMADRIRGCLRGTDDIGARVGGDEMMVVLHGVRGIEDAVAVAEKLRKSAEQPIPVNSTEISTTVSIGVTLARPDESTDALVARADEALYQAKRTGRNQVVPVSAPEAPADSHAES